MTKLESVLYALKCRAIDNPSTCNECPYYIAKWYCCDARSIMKDALDLLEGQEWVSVMDFLPSAGGEYWTLRYFEKIPIIQPLKYGVPDGFDKEYFYAHDEEWEEDTIYGGITHWLPLFALPKLPKEKEND